MPDIYTSERKREARQERKRSKQERNGPLSHRDHEAGAFSAYASHPTNIHFENQAKGEHIEVFLRPHPITNVSWIVIAILMILGPILLSIVPFLEFLPARFQLVSILMWYLLTSAFIFESFLGWFFNIYIITDQRIVDIDFHNLIYKEVSDANVSRIQDVTYRMTGVFRTIFNYGNVFIQTAGAAPNFEFLAVPNPDEVVKTLQQLREEKKEERV